MINAGRSKTLSASLILGLALATCTTGCMGHGRSTSEGLTLAHERMAQIKSATQWEMANESYMAGDLERALESVNNSLSLNPSVAKSHTLRGKILFEMGRLEEARDSLLRAEIINPNAIEAVYFLGIVYERLSQQEEALAYYQKAAAMDPAEAMYAVASAEILIDMSKPEDAESYLNERSNVFGHNAGVQQTLGHIAMIQGNDDEAEKRFRTAWTLSPEEPAILEDLVNAQMQLGRYAEAEHNINQLLQFESYKGRRDILRLRSRCLLNLDRTMEAREVLLKLTDAKDGQGDLGSWLDLGVVSYSINDMPRLRQAAQRIIELAPERSEGHLYRALWQRKHGDNSGALSTLQKGFKSATMPVEAYLLRGMIEQELGMNEAAQRSYSTATQMDPTNTRAKDMFELLNTQSGVASFPADTE